MKAKSKMIRTATSFLLAMFILAEMSVAATVDVPDKTIASKRIGSMVVVLANDTGKLIPARITFVFCSKIVVHPVPPTSARLAWTSDARRQTARRIYHSPSESEWP